MVQSEDELRRQVQKLEARVQRLELAREENAMANLMRILTEQNRNPVAYITTGNLANDIQAALVPRNAAGLPEYPRMLYRQSRTKTTGEDETLIVQNAQEQEAAEKAEGWHTAPTPQPPGYPQYWAEIDPRNGASYRRIMLRNRDEETRFRQSVNLSGWTRDTYPSPALGGYPIDLDTLIAEHHARLHQQLDAQLKGPEKKESS